jgi:hypothetical protein
MEYIYTKKHDALRTWGEFEEQLSAADHRDYSEEAIPERDPAYQLPVATWYQEATIELLTAEERLDMARQLQLLGMSRARAAAVASLS